MTLPDERYWALRQVPEELVRLATAPGPVRKRDLRAAVRWLIKHYPTSYEIDQLAEKCPHILKKPGKETTDGLRRS
jgi:hypothetical protein